jgi:Sec7-like guanine-nucleotide exchange factor
VLRQLADDPEVIANFLLHTEGLDDAALGDYMGDGDETASKVLKCYVSTFRFHGLGFDDALRKFLSAFRLPGEAQKIERIMETFSAQFYDNNPGKCPFVFDPGHRADFNSDQYASTSCVRTGVKEGQHP